MPTLCCSSADSTPRPWYSAMAVIGPAQVVGRIAIWVFASRVQIRVIGSLVVLAFPLVFLGLMVTPPVFPAVALIVATYGAANGIMTIVRGLVAPEMEDVRVQSDARKPFRDEPRILPCCHSLARPPAAGGKKSACHLAGHLKVVRSEERRVGKEG